MVAVLTREAREVTTGRRRRGALVERQTDGAQERSGLVGQLDEMEKPQPEGGAAAGVRRISLATSLYRAAMGGLLAAAREVREAGTFGYLDGAPGAPELDRLLLG
jgi:hypothetical protein